jgi:hypothetical protein
MAAELCRRRVRRRLAIATGAVLLSTTASGCFWQQPGYGPEHARYNPSEDTLTAGNVGTIAERWSVDFPGRTISEPLISGGGVYLTSRSDADSAVQALRLSSGAALWEHPVESGTPMVLASGVTFSGGSLWLSHLDFGASPCPTALTGLDPDNGDVVASDPMGNPVSDLVTSGTVAAYTVSTQCLADGPDMLVVRDADTRATQWTYTFPGPSGTPTVSDGVIYVHGAGTLYAFTATGCGAATCSPLWARTMGGSQQTFDVVVADGHLFVIRPETFVHPVFGTTVPGATLSAHAADTGDFLWSKTYFGDDPELGTGWGRIEGIAVADGTVYVAASLETAGDPVGTVDAFPAAGCGSTACNPAWSGALPATATPGLVVGGGVVYVGATAAAAGAGGVAAFDTTGCGSSTCSPLVTVPVTGTPTGMSLAQGTLLVRSSAGSDVLTALSAPA